MELAKLLLILFFIKITSCALVINTWRFQDAAKEAWNYVQNGYSGIDAIEAGCKLCESLQCDFTVGYGGSPDESGETTLDAMIFDGKTMDMGAVGALRRVKSAISVAKHVLHNTQHSFLVGDQATAFAIEMGFKEESLSTNVSKSVWQEWKKKNCQPNSWKNVEPNPAETCGPYQPLSENSVLYYSFYESAVDIQRGHDTIGMVVLDKNDDIAAGTSTNGLRHKIPGRVGDSPIPGAGAYADNDVGAACATGDGDVMMRFLPSFLAVEQMRRGRTPIDAARIAITRITDKYPNFSGAVIAVNMKGEYGAACNLIAQFPYSVATDVTNTVIVETVPCSNPVYIENLWNGTSFGSKYLIRIISLRSLIETNLMITIYSTRDKWLAQLFKMPRRVYVLVLVFFLEYSLGSVPIVINTWTLPQAAQRAWEFIQNGSNSIDALEAGCGLCENLACGTSIGYGGNPDEAGETTLDAMIFDGKTMDMGGVGALRRVKGAISVAKHVLLYTLHSLIVGDQATAFAVNLGFPEETLTTDNSTAIWQNWTNYNCQPNHWMNVEPNPATSCGPYQPLSENSVLYDHSLTQETIEERTNHDTIGMIVIDGDGNIAAGTSTNGLRYKIPGRVGDSPLPGAGAYADNDVGGACATGNGDVMMRFLPSFLAVEEMRRGSTPADAAGTAIRRIIRKYPAFSGAVIAVNKFGEYGAACNIMDSFPYAYINNETNEVIVQTVPCMVSQGIELNPPKFLIILVLFNLLKFCT